jgi:hypothetical protein
MNESTSSVNLSVLTALRTTGIPLSDGRRLYEGPDAFAERIKAQVKALSQASRLTRAATEVIVCEPLDF